MATKCESQTQIQIINFFPGNSCGVTRQKRFDSVVVISAQIAIIEKGMVIFDDWASIMVCNLCR